MNAATIEIPEKMARKCRSSSAHLPVVTTPSAAPAQAPLPAKRMNHIVALVNVGWGNSVYIRGEGGNLSWEVGAALYCVGDDRWVYAYPADNPPRAFKFTFNDKSWALGENIHPDGNEISIYVPQFSPHQVACEQKYLENSHGLTAQPS